MSPATGTTAGGRAAETVPVAADKDAAAPLVDERLRLADGRLLAWAEWGDRRGRPLLLLHPRPGSRLLCPDRAATAAAGVRLITVDRPGYGGSDPVPDPTVTGFAADLGRLIDHLWLGQVPVAGWSAGGLYAAACAAVLGERVSALALVATPAPDDEVRWLTRGDRTLAATAATDPDGALAAAARAAASLTAAPETSGDPWDSPADLAVLAGPDVWPPLTTMWREAFRPGPRGHAADLVALSRPWGFAPAQVRAPTTLHYGDDDPVLGHGHQRWWTRALPHAELTVHPGAGHLVPFVAWAGILASVTR
jgi:pimeloyl-ACP methyl ester carboxylesterase